MTKETEKEPVKLTLRVSDIKPELCVHCAACCTVELHLNNVNSRMRQFYRSVGLTVKPDVGIDKKDCCEETHDCTVVLGPCIHLKEGMVGGVAGYICDVYDQRSQLCQEYNCVAWALAHNTYNSHNELLLKVQKVYDQLHQMRG